MRKTTMFLALGLISSLLGGFVESGTIVSAASLSTSEVTPPDIDVLAEDTNAFDLPLLYSKDFSDDHAWVQYEDGTGNIVTSVIAPDGSICFSLPAGIEPSYMSPFAEGYSYYRVGDEYETSYEAIVDVEGNECYRTVNSGDKKSWEHIFGQANGLFVIYIQETGMEAVTHTISIAQADGSIVSSFSEFGQNPPFGKYPLDHSDDFTYLGEGWYQYPCDTWSASYLNFDQQRIEYSSEVGDLSVFIDGETISSGSSKKTMLLDANLDYVGDYPLASIDYLNKITVGNNTVVGEDLGNWSSPYRKCDKVTYYDAWGNKICDITEYPNLEKRYSPFYGDYAVLYIFGADKHYYVTAVNRQGVIMFEPYELVADGKTSDAYARDYVYGEYMIIQTSDEQYSLMDMNGELVHSISADFPGCEISQFGNYSAGFLQVSYFANGEEYRKYYPVAEAAAAGNAVYDLGNLGNVVEPETVTEDDESNNDIADEAVTETYDYTFISDFSIEGKWKSVGDSGFGQAQPGAIVVFDDTNCNFFSPKDTYALYQDGDTYKLDVTSYLFAETLTFTVNTISEDHITVISGDSVTDLERIE